MSAPEQMNGMPVIEIEIRHYSIDNHIRDDRDKQLLFSELFQQVFSGQFHTK
jgi:hypothetical protein